MLSARAIHHSSCATINRMTTSPFISHPSFLSTGTLYLVATPIGNLEDITHRALRILSEVDIIACEDTRHTAKLLNHFRISTRTISYHEHNEATRNHEIVSLIASGKSIALVSDAGTPAISDPGFRLVRACIENNLTVVPVPGATAFACALVVSGLPTDAFLFGGFLPSRAAARRARFAELREMKATIIFYEAPHRIHDSLRDAREILGERHAVVARELTKLHEEIARGTLSELSTRFSHEATTRGEIVLLIDRTTLDGETNANRISIAARIAALEAEGINPRAALKQAAREYGLARDEAYRRLIVERG